MYAVHIRLEHLPFRQVHPARRLFDGGSNQLLLKVRISDGAAGFNGHDLGGFGPPTLHDLGRLEEQFGAFGGGRLRPSGEGLRRGVNRQRRFRTAACCGARIDGPIVGSVDVERLVALSRAPLAVYEVLELIDPVHYGHSAEFGHDVFLTRERFAITSIAANAACYSSRDNGTGLRRLGALLDYDDATVPGFSMHQAPILEPPGLREREAE